MGLIERMKFAVIQNGLRGTKQEVKNLLSIEINKALTDASLRSA